MTYLEQYTSELSADLATSVANTASEVLAQIEKRFDFSVQLNGLLLGNVQSGKTGQMLGIMSRMADAGYRLFLLLTTDNVDLQRQTYNRVKDSLKAFNVISEKDEVLFSQVGMLKPLVIVLKKNASVLRKWKNILTNSGICKGLTLVVFDDEADAASLNTLVNKNRVSTINKNLTAIKDTAIASIYLQVTATPQAVILQSNISGWKPAFTTYFAPGKRYLGGNYFYSIPASYCARFISEGEFEEITGDYIDGGMCPQGLHDSIVSFLINCAYKKIKGESNCNFVIHPSIKINHHTKFVSRVQEELTLLQIAQGEKAFDVTLKRIWNDLQRSKPDLPHYDDIKEKVVEILDNTEIFVIPLNSKSTVCRDANNPNALDLSKGFNIVVGGNTLGRGLTFPNLQVVYYCRTSKMTQADTYWQHSRIFGYDREAELVRLYMPKSTYKLFAEMNVANEMLIKQVSSGVENIQLIYPNDIKPTRKNVLDNKYLNLLTGGTNYFASEPTGNNVEIIDTIVADYIDEKISIVGVEVITELLSLLGSNNKFDFDSQKFISCCVALSIRRPSVKCKLIVRTDRDIAKGTGTLLSPNDRTLGDSCPNDVVLTLYRVNGSVEKGWNGQPLWVPNIKFPYDTCFYDTLDIPND